MWRRCVLLVLALACVGGVAKGRDGVGGGDSPTALAPAIGEEGIAIPFSTIDGGGGESSGGTYRVVGTIGQPEAGYHTGGSFALVGGFRGIEPLPIEIFGDGFESGDSSAWSFTVGLP